LVYEWGTLVKPIIPITPDVSEIHHIFDKDVDDMPTFKDIAFLVHNYLSAANVHIAYNYEYDRGVLEAEFARANMKFPVKPMVDPLILFKKWHKFNKGKTLIKAAEKYGIKYVGAHRAVNDATVTGKVLFKMAATNTGFPKDIKDLVNKQRKWLEEQHLDFSAYLQGKGQAAPRTPAYHYYEVNI
jgi:DNA polymerase III alpha subunit (gram-positive type)